MIIFGGHDARSVVSEHEQTVEFLVLNSWLSFLLRAPSVLFTLASRMYCACLLIQSYVMLQCYPCSHAYDWLILTNMCIISSFKLHPTLHYFSFTFVSLSFQGFSMRSTRQQFREVYQILLARGQLVLRKNTG
jgi:hypothetical protein